MMAGDKAPVSVVLGTRGPRNAPVVGSSTLRFALPSEALECWNAIALVSSKVVVRPSSWVAVARRVEIFDSYAHMGGSSRTVGERSMPRSLRAIQAALACPLGVPPERGPSSHKASTALRARWLEQRFKSSVRSEELTSDRS